MGGENQQDSLNRFSGYSKKAQISGKPSYLEPNSGSLHVPIEGVYRIAEKIEDRSRIGEKHNQKHGEKAAQPCLPALQRNPQHPQNHLESRIQILLS
jgi:hypothetical protein